MLKKFMKLLEKRGAEKPEIDEHEKLAKVDALNALKKMASDGMAGKMKSLKKVSVMSDSEQGLKEGLEKAKQILPSHEFESASDEEAEESPEHEMGESPEAEAMEHEESPEQEASESPEHEALESPEEEAAEHGEDELTEDQIVEKIANLKMLLKQKMSK